MEKGEESVEGSLRRSGKPSPDCDVPEAERRTCRSCNKTLPTFGGLVRHIVLAKAGCKDGYSCQEVESMKKLSVESERAQRIAKGLQMTQEERSEKKRIRASRRKNKRVRATAAENALPPDETEDEDRLRLVHPSSARKLAALEDPLPTATATATLNIDGFDAMVEKFRTECSTKKLERSFDVVRGSSNASDCVDHLVFRDVDGSSKLNEENPVPFPPGCSLKPKMALRDCDDVECFVAMSLSGDGRSVEVRYLMHRDDVTLEGLRDVMHVVQSVVGLDLYDVFSERQNVFYLNPANVSLRIARDKYCRDILASGGRRPEAPRPICLPVVSREKRFVSPDSGDMPNDVPHHQLLLNGRLTLVDTAALGVQFRSGSGEVFIAPLFAVNMNCHWRFHVKPFADILSSWFGSCTLMNLVLQELPCVISARNRYIHDLMLDCYEELQKPKQVSVCSQCGQSFQFNRYVLAEARRYHIHLQSHQLNCKICGQLFTNCQLRKFHERSHKSDSFYCPHEGCNYVGRSSRSVETHVRHKHTSEVCEHCGKAFKNMKCLNLHAEVFHLSKKPKRHVCPICRRAYRSKNELDKHVSRHNKQGSKVDKWMNDEPSMYKYECTKHMTCKKYFKTVSSMKAHIRKYKDKDFPSNVSRFYRPDIPDGMTTIKDVELAEEDHALSEKLTKRKKKKMSNAKRLAVVVAPTESQSANVAYPFFANDQQQVKVETYDPVVVNNQHPPQQAMMYVDQAPPPQQTAGETGWGQQMFYSAPR